MRRHERLAGIVELVGGRGSASVEDLVEAFAVSPATARRDLDDLAGQQLLTRTRGGAVAHTVAYDLPIRYKSGRGSEAKRRIATAAAALVEPGAVVGLNGGTTTTEVGRAVALQAGERGGLTVVTNALNIANELTVRPQLKIVVVGGVLRPQTFELIGPFAQQVLAGVTIDLMILGVDALSAADGAAAANESEAEINRAMVARARRTIVVADGSKLGGRAFCTICPLAAIDALITDDGADAHAVRELTDAGIAVTTV